MANILYSELIDDVIDRLQHQVERTITEEDRQLLLAPQRLAKSATEALLRFCLVADAASIPDLVTESTLVKQRTFRQVNAYRFPEAIFAEREDNGILAVILNEEEMEWHQRTGLESVIYRANSIMYGDCDPVFAYDDLKKRLYAPCGVTLKILLVNIPHTIRPPEQGEFRGGTLDVTAGAASAGDITLSDGTNSLAVTLAAGDTPAQVATKILDAIVASTSFFMDAYEDDVASTINLNIRPDAPLNKKLTPSFTDTGATGAAATLTDTGTYILPVGGAYHDEITELCYRQLVSLDIGGQRKIPAEEQAEA